MKNTQELWIVDKQGVKRRAQKSKCLNCSTEFLQRKNGDYKFCSPTCVYAYKTKTKNTEVSCGACGKPVVKKISHLNNSKHGVYFCNRVCKEHAQSLDGNCKIIRPSHYGTGDGSRKTDKFFSQHWKNGCKCGEKRKYLLQVHHMDGNHRNNDETNFELVCGNCHLKRHLINVDGEWKYWPKVITPRDMLDLL